MLFFFSGIEYNSDDLQERTEIPIKKSIRIALIAICVVFVFVFAFSAYKIGSTLIGYKKAESTYTNLSNQFVTIASAKPTQTLAPEASPEATAPTEVFPFKVDFEALKASSPDAVGWIYSADTPINYPIVHTTDNVFYIEHLHNGEFNANGAIFIDCNIAPDFSAKNTLIYGHNMNDGSMFANLRNYRDPAYYPEHPVMYICTPDKYYRVEIVAGLITEPDSYVYAHEFQEIEQFHAYIESVKADSTFQSNVEVGDDDKIVTLSTCTYEINDGRYGIIGKLVEILPPEV